MKAQDWWNTHYRMTCTQTPDALSVRKEQGSGWLDIEMNVNDGMEFATITVRSREMAEQLRNMLDQALRA